MPIPFVLASKSPARLATLRSAGIEPRVIVSDVDEDAVLARAAADSPLALGEEPYFLARAKADAVVTTHSPDAIVLGCDSMLELDGDIVGKPATAEVARERWRAMRGRTGVLHTGHALIDNRAGHASQQNAPLRVGDTSSTAVRFANLSDAEIDAYIATGEPLKVAGAFTIDGLGGPYVEHIEGDHHGVVGVSLPLVRRLLGSFEVAFHELWG